MMGHHSSYIPSNHHPSQVHHPYYFQSFPPQPQQPHPPYPYNNYNNHSNNVVNTNLNGGYYPANSYPERKNPQFMNYPGENSYPQHYQ